MDTKHDSRCKTVRCEQAMLEKGWEGAIWHMWHGQGHKATGMRGSRRARCVGKKQKKKKKVLFENGMKINSQFNGVLNFYLFFFKVKTENKSLLELGYRKKEKVAVISVCVCLLQFLTLLFLRLYLIEPGSCWFSKTCWPASLKRSSFSTSSGYGVYQCT